MSNKQQLDEFKADGEDSSVYDPVTPAGGSPKGRNRPADKNTSVDPNPPASTDISPKGGADSSSDLIKPRVSKAPARLADKNVKSEAVTALFSGNDLSEEFMEKAHLVFEAAVHERVSLEMANVEEAFEARVEEQVGTITNEIVENLDKYLNYVVEQWVNDNQIAIERGIRTTVSESFMAGLKGLLEDHAVSISDDDLDLAESLTVANSELEARLNESIAAQQELRNQLAESKSASIVESLTTGLTVSESDRLKTLAESVAFTTEAEFTGKIKSLRENFFPKSPKVLSEAVDAEPIDAPAQTSVTDPVMAQYASALTASLRKS